MTIEIVAISRPDYYGRGEITFKVGDRTLTLKTLRPIVGYDLNEDSQRLNKFIMRYVNFDLDDDEEDEQLSDEGRADVINDLFQEDLLHFQDEDFKFFQEYIRIKMMTPEERLNALWEVA